MKLITPKMHAWRKLLPALQLVPIVPLLFVGLIILLVWSGGIDKVPGAKVSDFGAEFLPLGAFLGRWLRQGIFPLWNPHLFCGYPMIEIQQSALFYPLHLLTLLLPVPEAALLTAISVHLLVAFCATYFALRYCCGTSVHGSGLGAACYILNGCYTSRFAAGHLTYIYAISWLPFAILGFARLAGLLAGGSEHRRFRATVFWAAVTTIVDTFIVLSGAPQYVVYAVYGQLICCILPSPVTVRRRLLLYTVCWGFTAAIAAPQWLTTLDYLPFAARSSGTYSGFALTWQELTSMFLEFVLPQPFGGGIDVARFNPAGAWETNAYPGAGFLVLIIARLLCFKGQIRKHPYLPLTFGLLAISLYLILGGFAPGTTFFRNSGRAVMLVMVVVSMLSAYAFDLLFADAGDASGRMRKRVLFLSAAVIALLVSAMLWVYFDPGGIVRIYTILANLNPNTGEGTRKLIESLTTDPTPAVRCAVKSLLLALIPVGLLLGWSLAHFKFPVYVSMGVLSFLLLIDPAISHLQFFKPREAFHRKAPPPEIVTELEAAADRSRADSEVPWRCSVSDEWTNSSQYTTHLQESSGYDPLMPIFSAARRLRFTQRQNDRAESQRLIHQSLGVRYVLDTPTSGTGIISRRYNADAGEIRRHSIAELVNGAIAREVVGFGPIDGRISFIAPEDLPLLPPPLLKTSEAELVPLDPAVPIRYDWAQSPNRMRFLLDVPRDMLLIVKSTWLPGWRAQVTNAAGIRKEAPVKINGWHIGLPLRTGDTEVVLVYIPRFLKPALVLSALALLAGIGFLIRTRQGELESRTIKSS